MTRNVLETKGYFTMIKQSIHQEDVTTINTKVPKYDQQKVTDLKGETVNQPLTVTPIPLSVIIELERKSTAM